MGRTFRTLTALAALALVGTFVLPEPADARSSRRRNYAEEWEREEREERYREERERAREERMEHEKELQEKYHKHSERQMDKFVDGFGRRRPAGSGAAAAPPKKSGTCIYGEGNKVLYQPPGAECNYQ
jgi:hypothetical protein